MQTHIGTQYENWETELCERCKHLRACALKLFSIHLFNPCFGAQKPGSGRLLRLPLDFAGNFTDAVTCTGRSTKLFASPVSQAVRPVSEIRNSTQHGREQKLPLPPAGNVVWNDLWIQRASDSLLNIACRGKGDSCIMSNKPTSI